MRCSREMHELCLPQSKTPAGSPGLRAINLAAGCIPPLPYRTGGRKCLPPVSACRLGWRGIWRGSALGRAAMTERPFPDRSEERRVGKSVSVRVDLGGRRIIKKKKIIKQYKKLTITQNTYTYMMIEK